MSSNTHLGLELYKNNLHVLLESLQQNVCVNNNPHSMTCGSKHTMDCYSNNDAGVTTLNTVLTTSSKRMLPTL